MLYIPQDGVTPLDPAIWPDPTARVEYNRRLTSWFISVDPVYISLVPREKAKTPSGAYDWMDLPPRPEQRMTLIYQSGLLGGIQIAEDGVSRRFDMVLVAEWNATVKLYDFWEDPGRPGNFWQVTGLDPYNGYEVKAGITAYGRELDYGG